MTMEKKGIYSEFHKDSLTGELEQKDEKEVSQVSSMHTIVKFRGLSPPGIAY